MKNEVAIVIPVYKEKLNKFELESLKQCVKVFGTYPIYFATHDALDLGEYFEINKNFKCKFFSRKYFDSIYTYNQLMININFYKAFKKFKYILIHQLDVYVFKDDLKYWISSNYDYVGAPWKRIQIHEKLEMLNKVGNGGFSLRKVDSFITVLRRLGIIYPFSLIYSRNRNSENIFPLLRSFYFYLFKNNFFCLFNRFDRNEDMFWGVIVPEKYNNFIVPSANEAAEFCIENDVKYWLQSIFPKFPMATHAYDKNLLDWQKYILI